MIIASVYIWNFRDIKYLFTVVAHELCHQWFGNLVTMNYWNEPWLNEGLTSYTSYEAAQLDDARALERWLDHSAICWLRNHSIVRIVIDECHGVMDEDMFLHSRPLNDYLILSPSQFEAAFDSFTYQKGWQKEKKWNEACNCVMCRSVHHQNDSQYTGKGHLL